MRRITSAAILSVLSLCMTGSAFAHDYTVGTLKIGHPWSRATPNAAKVAAGYLSVTNSGNEADRLTGGTFENAGRVEVHSMSTDGGVMKMAPVDGGLPIKPGETVTLQPAGYHMMFMDLRKPLKKGEMIKGTLAFEKAGTVAVEFKVEDIAAKASKDGEEGHAHDHAH